MKRLGIVRKSVLLMLLMICSLFFVNFNSHKYNAHAYSYNQSGASFYSGNRTISAYFTNTATYNDYYREVYFIPPQYSGAVNSTSDIGMVSTYAANKITDNAIRSYAQKNYSYTVSDTSSSCGLWKIMFRCKTQSSSYWSNQPGSGGGYWYMTQVYVPPISPSYNNSYPKDEIVVLEYGKSYASQSVTLSSGVTNGGFPSATYQWYRVTPAGSTSAIGGAKSSTLTLSKESVTMGLNGMSYYCVISHPTGTITTKKATLNVLEYSETAVSRYAHTTVWYLPTLDDTTPEDVTIIYNDSDKSQNKATMQVNIAEHGNPAEYTYEWFVRKNAESPWESTGVTTQTIALNNLTKASNGYQFYCEVTNTAGTVASRVATLTVLYTPILDRLNGGIVKEFENISLEINIATAGNPDSYTYTWYEMPNDGSNSWRNLTFGTPENEFLHLNNVTRDYHLFKYCVKVTNDAGTVTSTVGQIHVLWLPDVKLNDTEIVNAGYSASYPVQIDVHGNDRGYEFKWYEKKYGTDEFVMMNDQATNALTFDEVELTLNGNQYYCEVTNMAGTVETNIMTLDVRFTPVLEEVTPQTVHYNNTATFKVSIKRDGNPTDYTYQWYCNEVKIDGATASTYTTPITDWTMNTNRYHCVVTSSAGSVTSNRALLTVYYPAGLATFANFTVIEGESHTLRSEISFPGNPEEYTYKWFCNGEEIQGATESTYSLVDVDRTMHQNKYSYSVTNIAGTTTSNEATINVEYTPVLKKLDDVAVIEGETATFISYIDVIGNPDSYTYEWYYRQNSSAEWTLIPTAGNSDYSIVTNRDMDGYQYFIRVRNNAGYVDSNPATLTVMYKPVVSSSGDAIVIEGNKATFSTSIAEHGNPKTYSYQWYVKNNGAAGWSKIEGATKNVYTMENVSRTQHLSQYYCEVHNAAGDVNSKEATLYVYWLPDVTNPNNVTVNEGQATKFEVKASNGNPNIYTYQWYCNDTKIVDATESVYNIEYAQQSMNGNRYHCVVTNAAGDVKTEKAVLTVYYLPVVSNPVDFTAIEGDDASFSVSIEKDGNPQDYRYQWFFREVTNSGWQTMTGQTKDTITLNAVNRNMNGYQYMCQVISSAGMYNTNYATLTVHYLPSISSPYNAYVVEGDKAEFDIAITTPGNPEDYHYQWQYREADGMDWIDVTTGTGYDSNIYTTEETTLDMDKYQYRCLVTNAAGTVATKNYATLRVYEALDITGKTTVTEGLTLELGVNNMEGVTFEVSDESLATLMVDKEQSKLYLKTFDGHTGSFILAAIRDVNGDRFEVEINVIEKVVVDLQAQYIGPDILIEMHYDKSDVKIVASYNNGTKDPFLGSDDVITIKNTLVTIIGENHYNAEFKGFTAPFTVIGLKPSLDKIKVTTPPVQTVYGIGENFSKTGMVVTAYYNNETSKEVTNYTVIGSPIVSGQSYVTIEYTEDGITKQTTTPIYVDENTEVSYPGEDGWITFYELYRFENISFRTKTTMEEHPESNGWIDVTQVNPTEYKEASIKAGYGFELKVYTNYYTNRSSKVEGTISTNMWEESYIDADSGESVYNYSTIYPLVTSIKNPDVLYIKIYNRETGKETKFVTNTDDDTFIKMEKTNNPSTVEELNGNEQLATTAIESRWDNSTKIFELEEREVYSGHPERKIYTDSKLYESGGANQYVVTIISPIWYGYDWEAGTDTYGYFVKNYTSKAYTNGAGSLQICMSFLLNIEANDELHTHILQ